MSIPIINSLNKTFIQKPKSQINFNILNNLNFTDVDQKNFQ